jgi:hypothetical protein
MFNVTMLMPSLWRLSSTLPSSPGIFDWFNVKSFNLNVFVFFCCTYLRRGPQRYFRKMFRWMAFRLVRSRFYKSF